MALPVNKKPDKTSVADLTTEKTVGQTAVQTITVAYGGAGTLDRDYSVSGTYRELRALRRDPTVALARGLLVSCIQAGGWTIEADEDVPDERRDFMKHILPLRDDFLGNTIAYGLVDYGWQGYEKIFAVRDGRIVIESLKPLLHDFTTILVTEQGRFNGYRQRPNYGTAIDLNPDKCFHSAFGVEAGGLYGRPLLADIHEASDMWKECNAGAKRYDEKIAGSHWVIYYPPGTSMIDGVSTDNSDIATLIVNGLQSSGYVTLPSTTAAVLQELNTPEVAGLYSWKVELISDASTRQESFSKRLSYLDTLKVRGLRMPERSILEGNFGTLAEATAHQDFAVTHMESIDRQIVASVNKQLINPLLRMNYGEQYVGKVRIVPAPLIDTQIEFLRKVYAELSKTDPKVNLQGLRDKLNIPTSEAVEVVDE